MDSRVRALATHLDPSAQSPVVAEVVEVRRTTQAVLEARGVVRTFRLIQDMGPGT